MATIEEMIAQREAREAPTEFGRKVLETVNKPTPPITIDGVPFDEVKESVRSGMSPVDLMIAKRVNRQAAANPDTPAESLLATDPVPRTGVRAIDEAGQIRTDKPTNSLGLGGQTVAQIQGREDRERFPSNFEFDSEESLIRQRANQGVDFRRGLPILQRLKTAAISGIPEAQGIRRAQILSQEIAKVPDNIVPLQYDPALNQFYLATQITEEDFDQGFETNPDNIGKFRYVAMDEAGVSVSDIADLANPGLIGSVLASVIATPAPIKGASMLKFSKGSLTRNAALGGGAAAVGRITGEALSVLMDVAASEGEFIPTSDQLWELGIDVTGQEMVASLVGESLARSGRYSTEFIQDAVARMTGREGAYGSKLDVATTNANVAQAKEDLIRIKDVTGKDDVAISRGQAAKSIDMLELENSRIKNSSPGTARQLEADRAKSRETTKLFLNNTFGADAIAWNGRHGTIEAANRSMAEAGVMVTKVEGGTIGFHPFGDLEHGLKVRPKGTDEWQVTASYVPFALRGVGFGTDMYKAAATEARAHGKVLVSSDNVKDGALGVWRALARDNPELGQLEFNPDVTVETMTDQFGEQISRTVSNEAGVPVVKFASEPNFTSQMLAQFTRPAQGKDGKIQAAKEFARFLRKPGAGELGKVMSEIEHNRLLRQDVKEAIFKDYERKVATGDADAPFNQKAFETWKEETGGMLERVFTPEEMLKVRTRGGLREVVTESRERVKNLETSLSKHLDIPVTQLKNPSAGSTIYQQLKNMDVRKMRRTVALLKQTDQLDSVRTIFNEDLANVLRPKAAAKSVSGQGVENMNKFVRDNSNLIRMLHPDDPNLAQQYVSDLGVIARIQDRLSMRTVVAGTREEANPSALALTRVAFGPLSRAQRFLTAARRLQTRQLGNSAIEMVSDPDKLRQYMRIRELPLNNERVMQTLSRIGFADYFGDRDLQDPEVRQAIADEINETRILMDQVREDE